MGTLIFDFDIIGMKLRYTTYHLMVAMTSEILMVTTIAGCDVDWCSRPRLQETGVVLSIVITPPKKCLSAWASL